MLKKALLTGLIACSLFGSNLTAAPETTTPETASPEVANSEVASAAVKAEGIEPADSYKLLIDGKEYEVFTDRETPLPVKLDNPKVSLKVEALKTFNYGGIVLQYPRYFTFEADLNDEEVSLWNLSGNSCVLMIQKYPADMDHIIMAKMLQPRFGEGNAVVGECEMMLNGSNSKGSKVVTTIGDSTISQEIFSFKVEGGSLLLIFQDTLNADGSHSEEGLKFQKLVSDSLKIPTAG